MMNYNSKLSELLREAKTWSDLKLKLESFNTSQTETSSKKTTAGKLFEYFAKYYFIVNPEYSQLYSKVWLSQTNKDYKALGKWVNDQRHNFKRVNYHSSESTS